MGVSNLKLLTLLALLAGSGLAGCGGDMDDLDRYINEIERTVAAFKDRLVRVACD